MNSDLNFFKKIQDSNEKTKQRWLWVFVSLSAFIIIFLWVIYLNHNLKNVALVSTEIEQRNSFWQIFKNGLQVVTGNAKSSLSYYWQIFKGKFFAPQSFIIQPE